MSECMGVLLRQELGCMVELLQWPNCMVAKLLKSHAFTYETVSELKTNIKTRTIIL